jgi:hypothetical protein
VETKDDLNEVYSRLHKAGGVILEEGETTCCYAKSEKSWIDDPSGIPWEVFLTTGDSVEYGDSGRQREARTARQTVCCEPKLAEPLSQACCAGK